MDSKSVLSLESLERSEKPAVLQSVEREHLKKSLHSYLLTFKKECLLNAYLLYLFSLATPWGATQTDIERQEER